MVKILDGARFSEAFTIDRKDAFSHGIVNRITGSTRTFDSSDPNLTVNLDLKPASGIRQPATGHLDSDLKSLRIMVNVSLYRLLILQSNLIHIVLERVNRRVFFKQPAFEYVIAVIVYDYLGGWIHRVV